MQNNIWQDFDFDEFEEQHEKKKSKRQSKRKWREIEEFKDRQIERKVMDINDHYYSM
ncbi:MAG: DUF3545 family protein [Colwellia sp.]|nr:DUF3545 family protein [Colwellia sp.]